jgi:hypothetical protein
MASQNGKTKTAVSENEEAASAANLAVGGRNAKPRFDVSVIEGLTPKDATEELCNLVYFKKGTADEVAMAATLFIEKLRPESARLDIRRLLALLLRIIELKEMPYSEYLQTPEWKATAEKAKALYGDTCALDARHPAEDAHHNTYARLGREWWNDVIPLCRACHTAHHKR